MGNNVLAVECFKQYLHSTFRIKDLSPLKYYLGILIAHSEKLICLSQHKFIMEIIFDVSLSKCKPVVMPLEQNLSLTTPKYDIGVLPMDEDPPFKDPSSY